MFFKFLLPILKTYGGVLTQGKTQPFIFQQAESFLKEVRPFFDGTENVKVCIFIGQNVYQVWLGDEILWFGLFWNEPF